MSAYRTFLRGRVVLPRLSYLISAVGCVLHLDRDLPRGCLVGLLVVASHGGGAAQPRWVAGAIQNFGGFISGALTPILTAFIAQTWSFVPALLAGAGIAFLGAMSYRFLVVQSIPEARLVSWWLGLSGMVAFSRKLCCRCAMVRCFIA